ncbi:MULTISPECIES: hypothetical protein [unclassified Nocardia]|uniref:hypothetical protein n=1 Tax=unclassified Nocardia TaxID=2637762 RepID=UPI001CE48FA2|nr:MULTISPECIES: hypothetical protein [unclassified Nocardia]
MSHDLIAAIIAGALATAVLTMLVIAVRGPRISWATAPASAGRRDELAPTAVLAESTTVMGNSASTPEFAVSEGLRWFSASCCCAAPTTD